MSAKVPSPLIDVAMGYVNDINPDICQDTLDHIRSLFDSYISGTLLYDKIATELSNHLENLTPLEKISSILSLVTVPPPSFSTALEQNFSSNKSETVNHRKTRHLQSFNNLNGVGLSTKEFSSSLSSSTGKNRKKTRSWTDEEDQRLLMGVHLHGLENWTLVAQFVGNNRTRSMCSQRWIRVLDPKISKNHWTEEEDQQLLQMVQLYGEKSWMKISSKLGNRSDVQCRYHYKQLQKESKIISTSSPLVSDPSNLMQSPQKQQSSIFSTSLSSNYVFPSPFFSPAPTNSSNIMPSPTSNLNNSISTKPSNISLSNSKSNQEQLQQNCPKQENKDESKQFDLFPLTERELQLRLEEPFGIDYSLEYYKTDPMFCDSFW